MVDLYLTESGVDSLLPLSVIIVHCLACRSEEILQFWVGWIEGRLVRSHVGPAAFSDVAEAS